MTVRRSIIPVVLAACLFGPGLAPATAGARGEAIERAVVRELNQARAGQGLPRLNAHPRLARAADRHSADMLRADFFAHESSNGTPFERRVRRYHGARTVGENLAALSPRGGVAAEVVRMWMASAGHRAIILERGFAKVGIGARTGELQGSRSVVVTADFASRR